MVVRRRNLGSRRGSEVVESMLMLLPLFALVFLIIDTSWGLFIKATLEYSVQTAVNNAAAGATGPSGQMAAIAQTVETQSLHLVKAADVVTNFYAPASMSSSLPVGAGVNAAGNVVEVDVDYLFSPLAPLFRSSTGFHITASAAAVLEASPAPSL